MSVSVHGKVVESEAIDSENCNPAVLFDAVVDACCWEC